ncbi:MAG: hypothetical protein QXN87_06410 [Candidatus Bathyarchaeia archaeon]
MRGKALAFAALVTLILILCLTSLLIGNAEASEPNYTIHSVNHTVKVFYNGYILINDTVKISGDLANGFLIGFPYQYGSHILCCMAYSPSNPDQKYDVKEDVSLNGHVGFYGVKILKLPQKAESFTLSVLFILSNSLLQQDAENTTLYTLNFPAYPSFTTNVDQCTASVFLPKAAVRVSGSPLDYSQMNLQAFTYQPANVTFNLNGDNIQMLVFKELKREIRVGGTGEVEGADSYEIQNHSPIQVTSIMVSLPPNASVLKVEDEFGRKLTHSVAQAETNSIRITLTIPIESQGSTMLTVRYRLPNITDQRISVNAFQNVNYYIEKAYLTIVLPEGARTSPNTSYNVERGVFQERVKISVEGASFLESFPVEIKYSYNPLWLSFRPTLWVWALAMVGCTVAAFWKRPKLPAAPPALPVTAVEVEPEMIKSFVDAYEEKRKISLEIKSLETAVSRGRIPRRRYKVQRKTLETRLDALSRRLADLKLKLRSAGGRYADLMQQLEVAETEIEEVESDIKSIEVRHRRGELTLEAYRRLLSNYESRRDKAETTINGTLIRLREELR